MKCFEHPIYVTRPYLPDLGEFHEGVKEILRWITDNPAPNAMRQC